MATWYVRINHLTPTMLETVFIFLVYLFVDYFLYCSCIPDGVTHGDGAWAKFSAAKAESKLLRWEDFFFYVKSLISQ